MYIGGQPTPSGFLKGRLCTQSQVCLIFIWQGQQCFEGFTHCHSIGNKWKQIACFLKRVLVALAITKESFSVVPWPLPSQGKGDSCSKPDLISSLWAFFPLYQALDFTQTSQHRKSPLPSRTWWKMKSHENQPTGESLSVHLVDRCQSGSSSITCQSTRPMDRTLGVQTNWIHLWKKRERRVKRKLNNTPSRTRPKA